MSRNTTCVVLSAVLMLGTLLRAGPKAPGGEPPGFFGRVVDARTRLPVPGAEVEVIGIGAFTTDEEGSISIPGTDLPLTVRISRVGYRTRTWTGLDPAPGLEFPLMPELILLEGVTVTAARMPLSEPGSGPVTVIEPDRVPGATDLTAALRTAVGIEGRDYVNYAALALRGTGTEHVLVALDGIRLNSPQNGLFDLTTLPVGLVRRAEIARGSGSALYGSSPVGGTVNLLTAEPERFGASLRTGIGSFGRRYVEAVHEHRVAPLGYVVGLSLDEAANDFPWTDDTGAARRMVNADRAGTGAFAKGSWREAGHRVNLFGTWSDTRRGVPGPTNWPSDSARRNDRQGLASLRHTFEPDERLRLDTRAYAGRFWQNYRDPAAFEPVSDTHRVSTTGAQADAAWSPVRWLVLQLGAEVEQSRLASSVVGEAGRLDFAGLGQARVEWQGLAVQPTLRLERLRRDFVSDTLARRSLTEVASPRLMVTWTGFRPVAAYASFGRSFRAPTFNELFWPADDWTRGNPALDPEWATGLELGLRGGGDARWRLGWYRNLLTDLIQWQPDDSARWRPVNVAGAVITGLEAELALDFGRFGLDGNFNWCRARSEGERLLYRPELSARAAGWARTRPGRFDGRVTLAADYSGDRMNDAPPPDTVPERMPGFALFDAGLEVGFAPGPVRSALSVGVRNLADIRAETVRSYPLPGRSWYAELRLNTQGP